ncbi:MAG: VCBS repeat-containing protein, partial [Verrucomicrobiota bacterium]
DRDGDMDLISASLNDDTIAWYEHDGHGLFTTHVVSDSADEAVAVIAADMDGDMDMDIVAASQLDDTIAWFENHGSNGFSTNIITTLALGAYAVFAVDIDGDGDMDLLSGSSDDRIRWFEHDGSGGFATQILTSAADGPQSIFSGDVDGDGDLDVLYTSSGAGTISWLEQQVPIPVHVVVGSNGTVNPATSFSIPEGTSTNLIFVPDPYYHVDAVSLDGMPIGATNLLTLSNVQAAVTATVSFAANLVTNLPISNLPEWWLASHGLTGPSFHAAALADPDGDGLVTWLEFFLNNNPTNADRAHLDFGDAPAPYPTLLSDGAAMHVPTHMTLGNRRDRETNGVPSALSDGDDMAGLDDEDGIVLESVRVGQLDASVSVVVSNAPLGARLDAWIDFNDDGSWGGPEEQISASMALTNGENRIEFDVPAWASAGTNIARFRISSAGGLGMGGPAIDGEVEDHTLIINPPRRASGLFFTERVVGPIQGDGPAFLYPIDLDLDGDMDVVAASSLNSQVMWYENDGHASFTTHLICTNIQQPISVSIGDMDRDGDNDVVVAGFASGTISWHENDGVQNFSPHILTASAGFAISVTTADMDHDGDLDILSASKQDAAIRLFENDGDGHFTSSIIVSGVANVHAMAVVDMDNDGDLDLFITRPGGLFGLLDRYENLGDRFVGGSIASPAMALSVVAVDVDGDEDIECLVSSS